MNLIEHFRMMLRYEAEANARALASLASVPESGRASPAYDRASRLLPHNQLARQVWLWRLTRTPYDSPSDWFPSMTVEQARLRCEDVDRQWAAYLNSLVDADLSRECRYTSSEGKPYTRTIHEILTHVFNHSTYHRGQIATLVTQAGGERAKTDFVAVVREMP